MKRISIGIVLSILFLILLVLGVSVSLLTTQGGSRWILNQVPGLTVEGLQGTLLSDWRAEQLLWQQDDLSAKLTDVQMQLRPSCLLRSTVCLDRLSAARIELNLPEAEEVAEQQQGIELPELQLPLSIEIEQLKFDEFLLNGESLLTNTGLRARWLADGIHISELGLQHQEYILQAKGHISPQKGWPVQLQLNAHVPIPDSPALDVEAQLSGSLQKLNLHAVTKGYLVAVLEGQVEVLDANLPAQLSLKINDFKANPDLPDTLTVAELLLQLQGTMSKGYQVDGQGVLSSTAEKMQLSLAALVKATGAQLSSDRKSVV